MRCRICERDIYLYRSLGNIAKEISKLSKEPFYYNGQNIDIYYCDICMHYQIPWLNENKYYDDYLMTTTFSAKAQRLQAQQAKEIYKLHPKPKNFFEIGCGDGSFLNHISKYIPMVLGIEPSKQFYEICIAKGYNVRNLYLDKKTKLEEKFDTFASRQVFEHLPNPKEVLAKIYEHTNLDGVGLIEVPNGSKTFYTARYYDIFTDHINYFTISSLTKLCNEVGFTVIEIKESFNGDYLECYLRKAQVNQDFKARRDADVRNILDIISRYQNVAAYGAGAKAFAILTVIGNHVKFKKIFDIDPNKQGRYLPNQSIKVSKPTKKEIRGLDLIVIFAASYQDEIIKNLKINFDYDGHVICLQDAASELAITKTS